MTSHFFRDHPPVDTLVLFGGMCFIAVGLFILWASDCFCRGIDYMKGVAPMPSWLDDD